MNKKTPLCSHELVYDTGLCCVMSTIVYSSAWLLTDCTAFCGMRRRDSQLKNLMTQIGPASDKKYMQSSITNNTRLTS